MSVLPKHLNHQDFQRRLANFKQQEKYLGYYYDRMEFWYSTLNQETNLDWCEVCHSNFELVVDRIDYLCSVLY